MTKWALGLLLVANVGLFVAMQWGGKLTVDADVLTAQLPVNAEKITLVSAVLPASTVFASSSVLAVQSAASASVQSSVLSVAGKSLKQCMVWGEFSGEGLLKAQADLETLQLGDRLTHRVVEHEGGYWVFIPPLKNHAEVLRKIEQLKARGVSDYFIVQEAGVWMNAISLGVFRTEEAAQKYLDVMREKSVMSAKVGERNSKLKFTIFELKGLDANSVAKLSEFKKEFPGNELKVVDCN